MDLRAAVLGARVRAHGPIPCLLAFIAHPSAGGARYADGTLWSVMRGSIVVCGDGVGATFVEVEARTVRPHLANLRRHESALYFPYFQALCFGEGRIPARSPIQASQVLASVKVVQNRHVPVWVGSDDPEAIFAEIWKRIWSDELEDR